MGNCWRSQEKERGFANVQNVVEEYANATFHQDMHLHELIMSMSRHVPTKEIRELPERLVMHFSIAIATVVNLPDIDIWYYFFEHTAPRKVQ